MTQKIILPPGAQRRTTRVAVEAEETTNILVVDHDERIRDGLADHLSEVKCCLDYAASSEHALDLLAERRYSVVLAEVGQVGIDGFGILRHVRRQGLDCSVLVTCTQGSFETAVIALRDGADDFLLRPLDMGELHLAVLHAIQKGRLHQTKSLLLEAARERSFDLSRRIAELNALADAATVLSSSGEISRLLAEILRLATKVTMARNGSIMLLDESGESLIIKDILGPETEKLKGVRLPLGDSIAGWVAKRGEHVKIDNVETDPQFGRVNRQRFETKSLLSVPLKTPNRIVGVINLADKAGGHPFTDWDLRILRIFAAQASVAISDAEQFQKNLRKLTEITALYKISRRIPTASSSKEVAEVIFKGLESIVDCEVKIWFEPHPDTGELVAAQVVGSLGELNCEGMPVVPPWPRETGNEEGISRHVSIALTGMFSPGTDLSMLVIPVGPESAHRNETPAPYGVIALIAMRPRAFDEHTARLVRLAAAQAATLYERKSALLNASRLVTMGKMISEISHDLRKPLTNMKGSLQIVRAKHEISERTRQVLESTEQEIDHLAHLVSELVDFSNPQKYQTKLRPLKPVVDRALRMVEKDAQKRELTIKVEFPEDLPPIFHDENQILEAFLNIIINALESMEPGGTLTIRSFTDEGRELAGKCVCLEFIDTGCGIPETELARIFERYHTSRENGTGLGLAIVERIVQAHEGIIEVESEPGCTVFRLVFPAEG